MRLTMLISFVACGLAYSAEKADGPVQVKLGSRIGYIIPESYAEKYNADLIASIPGPVKIEGFWTPPEQDVTVAERVFRELIHAAVKDPTLLFPGLAPNPDPSAPVDTASAQALERERSELILVSENFDSYSLQYVGIIIDGQKLVFCNYSNGTNVDPSTDYIFIQKVFVPGGAIRFLQCRFDPELKTCSNVSRIGSWQQTAK